MIAFCLPQLMEYDIPRIQISRTWEIQPNLMCVLLHLCDPRAPTIAVYKVLDSEMSGNVKTAL